MSSLETDLAPQVRTMQIIVVAMCAAPLIFMGITQVIGDLGPDRELAILSQVGMVFGLVAVVMQNVLGRVITDQASKSVADRITQQPESLGGAYMSGMIVSVAICEGAAFLNLIAYAFQQNPWNIAMAAFLIVVAGTKFPTLGGVTAWVERTAERLKHEQQLNS